MNLIWRMSVQSKILAMAFAMAAEIERDLISQRTKEALRVKKTMGIKMGRLKGTGKSKLDPFKPEIEALLPYGFTQRFIAQHYHTTEGNLYNWMKKRGIKRSARGTAKMNLGEKAMRGQRKRHASKNAARLDAVSS